MGIESTNAHSIGVTASLVKALAGVAVFLALLPGFAFAQENPSNEGIEAKIRSFFADAPIMADVARCESRFRQYTDSGNPLYGGYAGKMVGIFQIYSDIHMKAAKAMGFDIETIEGNLAYARHLYDRQGTDPWLSSFPCWKTGVAEAATVSTEVVVTAKAASSDASGAQSTALTIDLSLGMIHPEVLTLQKILNGNGFVLTNEGPGSPGQETNKYGAFTREAVRRFQCAKNITCSGDEHTTGFGYVGPRTRAALVQFSVPTPSAPTTTSTDTSSTPPPTEAATTTATTSTPTPAAQSSDQSAEIARLQAQIAELLKVIASLQTNS